MMGENRKALNSIEEVSEGVQSHRPTWSAQGAPLLIADIYFASGEHAKAVRTAATAFTENGIVPLTNGYAGTVARWIARTSLEMDTLRAGKIVIHGLCDDLESHDLIDQAEILCARLCLDRAGGRSWTEGRILLAERLSRLPRAVEDQLKRLGAVN
jgi:hypothetical protein